MDERSPTEKTDLPILTAVSVGLCGAVFLGLNVRLGAASANLIQFAFVPDREIYEGKYWALLTSSFVHYQPLHFIFNMAWLWSLGGAFERTLGSVRWLLFVLAAALVSSGFELLSGGIGIGMSGVVYALFGFAWVTRTRYPLFAVIAHPKNVQIMVLWAIAGFALTYFKVMNIGNLAHVSGLAFGAALGGIVERPNLRPLLAFVALLMTGTAAALTQYNPFSPGWHEVLAERAFDRKDWSASAAHFRRAIELGEEDQDWIWANLAEIYGSQGDETRYREAIDHLKVLNGAMAKEIEARFNPE